MFAKTCLCEVIWSRDARLTLGTRGGATTETTYEMVERIYELQRAIADRANVARRFCVGWGLTGDDITDLEHLLVGNRQTLEVNSRAGCGDKVRGGAKKAKGEIKHWLRKWNL